ncbi:MAG: hypothetical protein J2P57_16560 [Acidimicrobiaceae bacterium]|nr:hypothetical protein [Acidimicrobiaceae bacterium]
MASVHFRADAEAGVGAFAGPIRVDAGVFVFGVLRPGAGRPLLVQALSMKLIANAVRASATRRIGLIVQRFAEL